MTFRQPETGDKRTVTGRLTQYRDDGARGPEVAVEIADEKEALSLPLEAIEKARLEIEL